MIARAAFMIVAVSGTGAFATEVRETVLTYVLDSYIAVCTPAMADPQAFITNLASWAPPERYGVVRSADGVKTNADVFVGSIHHSLSIDILAGQQQISCSTQYTHDETALDVFGTLEQQANMHQAFEAILTARYPRDTWGGGQFSELYIPYDGGKTVAENTDDYHFVIAGITGTPTALTGAQVLPGWLSFYTSKQTAVAGQ